MLVLSRKPGQKILIGDLITVTVVRIGPNTVRIGIDAPRDMNIRRDELEEEIDSGVSFDVQCDEDEDLDLEAVIAGTY